MPAAVAPCDGAASSPALEESLAGMVPALVARYSGLWWSTACDPPTLGEAVDRRRQKENARECARLIDEIARRVEQYPESEVERRRWRQDVKALVQGFGEERLAWPEDYRALLFDEAFYQTTRSFVRQARTFDDEVRADDLLQALRNVWIANSLQMMLDRPLELGPSIFAYSLLYPYTDNWLDDPGLAKAEKRAFNQRLRRRLRGEPAVPTSRHEQQVFRLVERIEDQYPRRAWPHVHDALIAIHDAQEASLLQQGGLTCPYEVDVLGLSVAKGGTSVLADGYLAVGALSPDEADFCFGYGVFLQLIDDLQDVAEDMRAGHTTIFAQCARRWPLDRLAGRLQRFVERVIDEAPRFRPERFRPHKDLIRRNCTFLLVGSIAQNPDLFSRPFLRELEGRWPFDFGSMRRLRRRSSRRYRRAIEALRRRYQTESLLDLMA